MKNKKKLIISIISIMLLIGFIGIAYSFYNKSITSFDNNVLVTGDIYMRYNGSNEVTNTNLKPMTKSEALEKSDNIFEFTITGKNTSKKDLYYGISLENIGTVNDSDIVVYLEEVVGENENKKVLIDGLRYQDLDNHVYVNYIEKNTTSEITKTYQLRVWLRDGIIVSDTESDADYTTSEWENLLLSLKVKVDGDLTKMNMPLMVDSNDYVENNIQYILASIKNYENPNEENELLTTNDIMRLEVSGYNTLFTYRDSLGNEQTTDSNNLDLTYTLNRKTNVDVQIFMKPSNDANTNTDIHVKLTKNGNIVYEIVHNIDLVGSNYCLNNGFTSLHDCILVSEHQSKSVNDAKTYIANKGEANINETAPKYTYVEEKTTNITTDISNLYTIYVADNYTFNSSTGKFKMVNTNGSTAFAVNLSNDYINYYTCASRYYDNAECTTLYKISSITPKNETTNTISGDSFTYKVSSSLDSQVGLYKTQDNYGDSFIYRGNVMNNNVYFGGYYWKIIRINGDNSIRLIFNGSTLKADGNKTASEAIGIRYFNSVGVDITHIGYMFNQEENEWQYDNISNYGSYGKATEYYFADDYEKYTDQYGRNKFKLKKKDYLFKSTLSNLTEEQINSNLYFCGSTSDDLMCSYLIKIDSVTSDTGLKGYSISFSPNTNDVSIINQNVFDSDAKILLESWYHDTLLSKTNNGNEISSYIADNIFCNDRSVISTYTNGSYSLNNSYASGYLFTTYTFYAARTRLLNAVVPYKSATLSCTNKNDSFSVNETSKTNGKLTYPIGLITADEVAFAGGSYRQTNEQYYLKISGEYLTMTPSYYYPSIRRNVIYMVGSTGMLAETYTSTSKRVKPVINLNSNVKIMRGEGTPTNPYIIE